MKTIINLTPHAVNFVTDAGESILSVAPSGTIARVSSSITKTGEIAGLPVTETVFGEVQDLPGQEEGVIYITSSLVAQRVPERNDVFIPNELVRNEQGKVIGCRSLGRV